MSAIILSFTGEYVPEYVEGRTFALYRDGHQYMLLNRITGLPLEVTRKDALDFYKSVLEDAEESQSQQPKGELCFTNP